MKLNKRRKATLSKIFEEPVRSDIVWPDIENLIIALSGEKSEGKGSRVRFTLNGVRAVFHRPHPKPTVDKGTVRSVRKFLETAGVNLNEI